LKQKINKYWGITKMTVHLRVRCVVQHDLIQIPGKNAINKM